MNILIVSQCSKRALIETRRILDQFAERKGDSTWQTSITQQGLNTLRKLLRKTAKRNTAVACHWIKSANRTELLWIVGNISRFNANGTVPTNVTQKDILRIKDENQWRTLDGISLLSSIAGLFHDFGKANILFQRKINPKTKSLTSEPYRHEWVSLRLFESFVLNQSDEEWLNRLANVNSDDETILLKNIDNIKDLKITTNNPFNAKTTKMTKLAQAIAWLIVTHHRLPKFSKADGNEPSIERIDQWMTGKNFDASWNSPQCVNKKWTEKDWEEVWHFPNGTPILSNTWQAKAQYLAKKALISPVLTKHDWFSDSFSLHLSRMVLMLSDHYYSSIEPRINWQDKTYKSYANTDRKTTPYKLNQKLDEHNLGVAHNAEKLTKILPNLRQSLPAITRHKKFKERSSSAKYRWQDKAFDLACSIREDTIKQGFFGVNMASTGCGKTFANGRIMYGLSDEQLGCRFSVALGLRTLTLQTGDALRNRLKLDGDDLAVLVGSLSVRKLYDENSNNQNDNENGRNLNEKIEIYGSESAEEFFSDHEYVSYEGILDDGRLSHWLKRSEKLHQLLSAPILVCTIDHLIPATEGERGGKQIAPMLRLLTSDLVLDEPDDFDLNDLPALSRLVNWAGMLGSRILLSSATLPPALVEALFDAYCEGRKKFEHAVGESNSSVNVCCAWFDENNVMQSNHASRESFCVSHSEFVNMRIEKIINDAPLRKAKLVTAKSESMTPVNVVNVMADIIFQEISHLHGFHHQTLQEKNKNISIGLVRMANIKPMVAVALNLISRSPPLNYRYHYCVYHGQYPLAIRNYIERGLDLALLRHNKDAIWELDSIKQAIENYSEDNHVFIVLASPVAEVGRDHDYDWAIAEPSSMRSLIQLAGRIQRHRQELPNNPNLVILSKNYHGLVGQSIAFTKPGFEFGDFKLESKDLHEVLIPEQFENINAVPRIREQNSCFPKKNLVDLEHCHLRAKLFGPELLRILAILNGRTGDRDQKILINKLQTVH